MSSPVEDRFIAAATAPLADNAELRMMAGQELHDCLGQGRFDAGLAAAAAEKLERSTTRSTGRWILYAATALVCLLLLTGAWWDYARWQTACWTLFGMSDPINRHLPVPFQKGPPLPPSAILGKFTPEQSRLLFGDPSKTRDQYQGLSEQSPDDAALFAEHAKRMAAWSDSLPPDYLKRADELAPDNGWFRYFAAGVSARGIVQETRSKTGKKYRITDPSKFEEAMRLMEEAAALPKFNSYRDEILLRRLAILPPGDDVLGRLFVYEFVSSEGGHDSFVHRSVGTALAAKLEELRISGDAAGFLRINRAWSTLSRRALEEGASSPRAAAWTGFTVSWPSAGDMAATASALGLEAEAKYYESRKSAIQERKSRLEDAAWKKLHAHGSFVANRNYSRSRAAPPLSDADLKPGRMADHVFLERLFCYLSIAVFVIFAGLAALFRFACGRQARLLSWSLLRVLGTRDYSWIIGAGVVLPAAIYLGTEHVEALAGSRWSVMNSALGQAIRGAAAMSLTLALPVELAAWRLSRRLTGRERIRWWAWLRKLVLTAATGVWAYACFSSDRGSDAYSAEGMQLSFIIAGCCAVHYFVISLVIALVPRRKRPLPGLVLCRAVLPAYACGVLLSAAAGYLWRAEEKRWIARETFTKIERGIPATSRFNYEVGKQISAELLEILDAKP